MHLLLPPPTLCSHSDHRPPPHHHHHHRHLKPPHHNHLCYLRSLGLTHPKLTTPPPPPTVSQLLSTIHFLKSKGFSEPDIPRIAYLTPNIFTPSFDPESLEPVFEFLTSHLAASPEDSRGLILKRPRILESDTEHCLKPTLEYLKGLGIKGLNAPTTLNAYLLDTRVHKFEEKMRFLREAVGLSVEEARRVCGRFPAVFGYGVENNLRVKYGYLVKEMRRDGREEVKRFPQFFGFSLEKRIKVRHLHLKQRNVDCVVPLNRMLLWSDDRFYKKWK